MIRWILRLLYFAIMGGGALTMAQETDTSELLKAADEMVQVTAHIRSLEPKAPIARGVKTRAEISEYLHQQVQENYSQGELQFEGKMLSTLGLIPASLDYKDFILKLFTEQVGGYYDPEKRTFFIASWLPVAEQKPIMAHELAHALQDQYFDVHKILKDDRRFRNDDRTMAHQALMEGDAMVTMLNYLLEPIKRNFAQLPDLAFIMRTQMSAMQSQSKVFSSAPAYIQESVLFPYGYGAAFLQKIWAQNPSWDSVNKIYSDLPSSTEQIMHPEKYYGTRDEPKPVNGEAVAAKMGEDWRISSKNVLGEFTLNLLLTLHLTEERSRRSAAGWGGDQVLLLENKAGKNAVLVETAWDDLAEADEFFSAMQAWFQARFPTGKKSDESATGFSLIQDKEAHALRREGTTVRFVIGMTESEAPKLARL